MSTPKILAALVTLALLGLVLYGFTLPPGFRRGLCFGIAAGVVLWSLLLVAVGMLVT